VVRYRFSHFVVSPRQRLLAQDGREVPLIPRYFDLLVLLIERRHEAVHRRDIFDRVWTDVIVSDSALSQAVRTIRRTLGDDPREPRFIRTVSRHGYRFVFPDVLEEEDDGTAIARRTSAGTAPGDIPVDPYEPLLERLAGANDGNAADEDRREAAELLHALGTTEALKRLGTRPGHAAARALLRDTRWDAPTASDVPVLGAPAPLRVAGELIALRLRRAARMVARRWAGASIGGGLAGAAAGAAGGLILAALSDSLAPIRLVPVLSAIGGVCGAIGGAGAGAGLSFAEAIARSRREAALVGGAALGGALVGTIVQWLARWSLAALVGLRLDVGGGLEGLVIGAAAGAGYAVATRGVQGGLAAPRGRRRLHAAALTALLCGLGGLGLTLTGRPLVGGTLHAIARSAEGSQVSLAPLGRLIGEPDFGPVTQGIVGFGEAAVFGLGLALGLTRRTIPASGSRLPASGSPLPASGSRLPASGFRL
jgi:DNA-binding winged helix-turn-helix (wHTH) protein